MRNLQRGLFRIRNRDPAFENAGHPALRSMWNLLAVAALLGESRSNVGGPLPGLLDRLVAGPVAPSAPAAQDGVQLQEPEVDQLNDHADAGGDETHGQRRAREDDAGEAIA